ncbi:glycosyl hydrolase family 18 protein [Fusibacter bizertensis]|uniref:Glycosyl hydrolase family 18 protein n=1 Tax=Fusibacter bizertensis TaxID=1488331 RepID=A0ABT6NHB3_9FIRM|nr:glycosyl hydrolase family 18 protein [Fusibacter bizertensis]MDH8679820.1 glycosyl hydrolase family 18 protein [Fusibacter bizertensis]
MKKTVLAFFSLVIVLVVIAAVFLAIDVESNLKVRRKINSVLNPVQIVKAEPKAVLVKPFEAKIDMNSKWILNEKFVNQISYMHVENLSTSWITYFFDEALNKLSIVDGNHQLEIDSNGNVMIDQSMLDQKVELKNVDDEWYISLTALNKIEEGEALGFVEQPYVEGKNLVIINKFENYNIVEIDDERLVFSDQEKLDVYLQNRFDISFLFKLKNLFSKTEIVGIEKNTSLYVFPTDSKSFFIISEDNTAGFIEIKGSEQITTKSGEKRNQLKVSKNAPENIVMTWEAVYSYNPDTSKIGPMGPLNVISPTWYELKDASGKVSSKASKDYVSWAKSNGYQVWALVSNAFDKDLTHSFLYNSDARKHFINIMLEEALNYGYEGINIDFENVYLEDKDALTHFIHEFSVYANRAGVILSMDVTVMGGSDTWSKCYDHEKLGQIVDFLIIMSYDEHWASSPISGPVSSYDWVKHHMDQLAEVVDSNKLVMGIPLYTRVWREYPSSEKANQYRTKSSAIGMEAQNNLLEKYQLTPIWDEVDQLYYATFFEEDAQVKMWIENAETISAKLNIVSELNLRGAAMWRRGFETEDIWDVFKKINP